MIFPVTACTCDQDKCTFTSMSQPFSGATKKKKKVGRKEEIDY